MGGVMRRARYGRTVPAKAISAVNYRRTDIPVSVI
jgi:hypothetical protein